LNPRPLRPPRQRRPVSKTIPLGGMGGEYVAIVSDRDFARVNKFRWRAFKPRKSKIVYAVRSVGSSRRPGRKTILMHRFILRLRSRKRVTDHQDHNGLNNTRRNIRACTQSQNRANQRACGCKGVIFLKRSLRKPFRVAIKKNRKVQRLGYFSTKAEGQAAYDKAARRLFGPYACLNFPEKAVA